MTITIIKFLKFRTFFFDNKQLVTHGKFSVWAAKNFKFSFNFQLNFQLIKIFQRNAIVGEKKNMIMNVLFNNNNFADHMEKKGNDFERNCSVRKLLI